MLICFIRLNEDWTHIHNSHTHTNLTFVQTFTGWLLSNGGEQTDHSRALFLQLVCSRVAREGHPSYEFELAWQQCRTCSFCKLCQWPLDWVPLLMMPSCFVSMCFSPNAIRSEAQIQGGQAPMGAFAQPMMGNLANVGWGAGPMVFQWFFHVGKMWNTQKIGHTDVFWNPPGDCSESSATPRQWKFCSTYGGATTDAGGMPQGRTADIDEIHVVKLMSSNQLVVIVYNVI